MSNNSYLPSGWLLAHIPPDIWREIFKIHVCEAILAYDEGNPDNLIQRPYAIVLSQICSPLRVLAVNARELWNTISLYLHDMGLLSPHPRLLELALDRSGSLPLRIMLDGVVANLGMSAAVRNAVQLLLDNFHRAEAVDINIGIFSSFLRPLDIPAMQAIFPKGTPLLRSLIFRGTGTISILDSRLWTMAPNLRNMVVDKSILFDSSYFIRILPIPFGQLTNIHMGPRICPRRLYELLSKTKNLIECTVGNLEYNYGLNVEPILLPSLRHLSLQACNFRTQSMSFLAYLKTPALNSLNLQDNGVDFPESYKTFAFFLAESSCSLQHFAFNVLPSDVEKKLKLLELLPQLTSLKLRIKCSYEEAYGSFRSKAHVRYRRYTDFREELMREVTKWDALREGSHCCKIVIEDDISGNGLFLPIWRDGLK
ncbi:hypothetical protein GALMADRAFT_282106 [Galerina marginata CBS 339.88]|uniref:F-box domain-containing protein n=1 Tax=Galerina marginata (strain CBS 339.88) TaxID=685588 RepID=A0A067SS91_GALM3|nr:hypothetical protein GALMADRAFT_282106 [Galerina marginata CBS 339.88]